MACKILLIKHRKFISISFFTKRITSRCNEVLLNIKKIKHKCEALNIPQIYEQYTYSQYTKRHPNEILYELPPNLITDVQ